MPHVKTERVYGTTDGLFTNTSTTEANPKPTNLIWIASQVLNSLLILCGLWISLSFLFHAKATGKWKRKKRKDFSGGKVLNFAVASTVLLLPRLFATQAVILVGFWHNPDSNQLCEIAMDLSIALYYVALLPVYTYLWLRQNALYAQPSITRLRTKIVCAVSWGSYIFLLLSGLGIIVLFVLPTAYMSSQDGCVLRPDEKNNVFPFYIMLSVQMIGQFTLLGLFVHPLIKHRKVQTNMLTLRGDSCPSFADASKHSDLQKNICNSTLSQAVSETQRRESTVSATSAEEQQQRPAKQQACRSKSESSWVKKRTLQTTQVRHSLNAAKLKLSLSANKALRDRQSTSSPALCMAKNRNRVLHVIRRSVLCAAMCMTSDLFSMAIVNFLLDKDTPKSMTNTVYDIGLLVNVFSVLVSFENCVTVIVSPCKKGEAKQSSQQRQKYKATASSWSLYADHLPNAPDTGTK